MKSIFLDIMDENGMFICTLRYRYHPIFHITAKELEDFVLLKRPTLKNTTFRIIPYDNES